MGSPPDAPTDEFRPDPGGSDAFFGWYHHALAFAYSVSAAVSAGSMPLDRLALYFGASLVGAYVVVAALTLLWRRLLPRVI
ncbi:hypothetical protein [Haloplanus halophilus]|uniref:hypothetical protein n=1 Tax=Haloplanus halophilus TaxID=2949993 RepID=UPI0020426795|nr:hypothetical protein [Haloplanus sp. GDY1]